MSTSGIFQLIANDGKADRTIMATQILNRRIADIMGHRIESEREWESLHARFILMLYERQSMLPAYHYWVLRRGHGILSVIPLDVRRIIIEYTHRWYNRAVPLEEIVSRCRRAGDKKLADHVQGFMHGRVEDAIYRPNRDYREWAL